MSAKPRRVADHLRLVTVPANVAGKVPPHNLDAERACLWAGFRRNMLARLIGLGLKSEHFYSEPYARVWAALAALAEVPDAPITPPSVQQWLMDRGQSAPAEGWRALLDDLELRAPHHSTPTYWATMVLELFETRQIQSKLHVLLAESYDGMPDRRAWNDSAGEKLTACVLSKSQGIEDAGQILKRIFEDFDAAAAQRGQGQIVGYPTGLTNVDQWLGGLVPAETMLLTGREKEGKSALGAQMCAGVTKRPARMRMGDPSCGRCKPEQPCDRHEWQWRGALIIQWEDPRDKTVMRLVGARARVDLSRIRTGTWNEHDQREFAQAASEFAHLPLKIEDACAPDVGTIGARVRAVRDDFASRGIVLAVVMIDSLQALQEEGRTREEEIDRAMKRLMALKRAPDLQQVSWLVINHTGEDGEMANAKRAPRRWCNTWLDLRVSAKEKEHADGGRPAYLELKVARDVEAGRTIPLWCYRACNNLFLDG